LLQEIHRSQNATSMMWRLYYTFKAEKSARWQLIIRCVGSILLEIVMSLI
jgi:hypothetical protein